MPPTFPINEAYLVATWLSASLWGAFTVIFIACIISTFTRKGGSLLKFNILFVIVMYGLATAHVSLVLARAVEGFIKNAQSPDSTILYFADIGQPLNRSKDMIYITLIVMGDFVVWWRCYSIWNKNLYVVALPAIMIIATAISGYDAVGHYFLSSPDEGNAVAWAIAMLAVSMTTNIILTCVSAGRIWYLSRQLSIMSFRAKYNRIIFLIIETGLVMSISKITEFVLFQLAPGDGLDGLNALYIVMDSMPQIMGICPTIIIMAVNSGFTSSNITDVYSEGGPSNSSGSKGAVPVFTEKRHEMTTNSTDSTLGSNFIVGIRREGSEV